MAFKASDLSVLAYANNFTLWHYISTDTVVAIEDSGYFDKASDMLRQNDLLIVNADTADTPETVFYIVTDNTDGAVSVAAYGD